MCAKLIMLLGVLVIAAAARAQQASSATREEGQTIQTLLKRIELLEMRVKELEVARSQSAAALATTPSDYPPHKEMPAQEEQMKMPNEPNLHIRGFTDLTFHGSDQRGSTSSFSLGQLNLFVTSELSERFKVLGEIVFEAGSDNAIGVDVERLLLQYFQSDYLNLSIGRYHTALGYYNTAYHHSTWLQTATGRPFLFQFEDDGGILPTHNVGISATGRIPSGPLGLHYVAEVGNGRASPSPLSEAVQNVVDENNHKAVNLGVFARPRAISGLRTGFSVYRDMLSPDGSPRVGETILAAHLVYTTPGFEWLNEGLVIRHAPQAALRVLHTPGFYTQISRRFGPYRPFIRYQYVNAPANEPFFPDVGLRHGPSLGLRFDVNESLALKLQYDRTELRQQPATNALTFQSAFTF